MAVAGTIVTHVEARTARFQAGMNKAANITRSFAGRSLGGLRSALNSTTGQFVQMAGGISLVGGALKSIQLAGQLEQTRSSLTAVLKSASKADSLIDLIEAFSAKTPFAFNDILKAAQTSLVTGSSLDDIPVLMQRLGDVAAGSGSNVSDLALIFGQVRTAGRLMTQDMNQFLTRGIPLADTLNERFGTTTVELRKMVSEGKVGFDDFEAAFAALSAEGGVFNKQMEVLSGTTLGKLSNLMDEVTFAATDLGATLIESFDLKEIIDGSAAALQRFIQIAGRATQGEPGRAVDPSTVGFFDKAQAAPIVAMQAMADMAGRVTGSQAIKDMARGFESNAQKRLGISTPGRQRLDKELEARGKRSQRIADRKRIDAESEAMIQRFMERKKADSVTADRNFLRTAGGGPGGLNPLLGGAGLGFSVAMQLAKGGGKPAPQEFNKLAGAMEKGSVEAMQAIQRRKQMAGASKAVQEEQLDVQRKMLEALLNPGKPSDTEVDLTK